LTAREKDEPHPSGTPHKWMMVSKWTRGEWNPPSPPHPLHQLLIVHQKKKKKKKKKKKTYSSPISTAVNAGNKMI